MKKGLLRRFLGKYWKHLRGQSKKWVVWISDVPPLCGFDETVPKSKTLHWSRRYPLTEKTTPFSNRGTFSTSVNYRQFPREIYFLIQCPRLLRLSPLASDCFKGTIGHFVYRLQLKISPPMQRKKTTKINFLLFFAVFERFFDFSGFLPVRNWT